jgi:sporulation-control protein spo0M
MSFLDKVKAAAGVGSTTLQVDIQQRPSKRGEELVAVARVVGGKTAQKMKYLVYSVEYDGKWNITNAEGTPLEIEGKCRIKYERPQNSMDLMINPGQQVEWPIRVRIPADSPLTGENIKYKLYVRADIDGAQDPEFNTNFQITG